MDDQIKPVAWVCTKATDGTESFREPFLATNVAYVNTHKAYDWSPLYSQQSIDALRAEVEVLKAEAEDYVEAVKEMGARLVRHREALAAAEAEAESLRAGAERYQALREALLDDESEAWEAFTQQPEPKSAADFDAAIDAARKGAEEVRYTITPNGREMLNGG